jgi:tetratricopeptide (TPR) repeat protein
LEFFQAAIKEDPDYVLPYTGIADVHTILAIYGLLDNAEAQSIAVEAAERALALNSRLAEANFSSGLVQFVFHFDVDSGLALLERAIDLKPDLAMAHAWRGMGLAAGGDRAEEGLDSARRACALDPDSPYIQGVAGITHIMVRRYPEAIAHFQRALDLEPEDIMAQYGAGICHSALGRHTEAVALLQQAAAISDRMSWVLGLLSAAYSRAGMVTEAQAILEELRERAGREHVTPVALAVACANNGLPEEALGYLEQALVEAGPTLTNLIRYPVWDDIQSNPRYTEVVTAMNWKPWNTPSIAPQPEP